MAAPVDRTETFWRLAYTLQHGPGPKTGHEIAVLPPSLTEGQHGTTTILLYGQNHFTQAFGSH